MERFLILTVVFAFLSRIEISVCDNHSELFERSAKKQLVQPFYPYSNSECVCSRNVYYSFLQCEGKFSSISSDTTNVPGNGIKMNCNKTIDSSDLNHDYLNLLGLNRSLNYFLSLTDCPEPTISYARQFFLPKRDETFIVADQENPIGSVEVENGVESFEIKCVHRKEFAITRKHLESLTNLRTFWVTCFALKSLPGDLFRGTTPNVETVSVSGTRIEYVPSGLFYNLTKLRKIFLNDNFIAAINGEAFLGCWNLLKVNFRRNRLSYLDDNLLGTLENLTFLDLSKNNFGAMPKNFRKLRKIVELDLSQNHLKRINDEHCDGFSHIEFLNVSYNGITHIHRKCFAEELVTLDISGNSLQNITGTPIVVSVLRNIYFKDNSVMNFGMNKIFSGYNLNGFYASNSGVFNLENDTLNGFPNLMSVDFNLNGISSIPENLFVKNTRMKIVHFQRNRISSIPSGLFLKNEEVYYIDLSHNVISHLPNCLFPEDCRLEELDLSYNRIENIPERFLANVTSLKALLLSNNRIRSLRNEFLMNTKELDILDLSYNRIFEIESETFLPFKESLYLRVLHLRGNRLNQPPVLRLKWLEYLDLSENDLRNISKHAFGNLPNLKELHLSRNNISNVELAPLSDRFYTRIAYKFEILDFSYNNLKNFSLNKIGMFAKIISVTSIDLSNNRFTSFLFFWIDFADNLRKLNLSCNNIYDLRHDYHYKDIPVYRRIAPLRKWTELRVLDLSSNRLNFNSTPMHFEERSLTWGCISPFRIFPNLEVLLLRNNSISFICLDWRIDLPNLKHLDLSHNKLQFLSHQDLIFRSTPIDERIGFGPYHWPHKLTVDVRHNEIRFVELPARMLALLPKKNETRGAYGHVTIQLEENPFQCGCSVFNLLRVIRYDVVLTTQLKRVTGRDGVFPAKLDIGNLSCSSPETVRGKKINNTEEWLHHLIPLFGICTLAAVF